MTVRLITIHTSDHGPVTLPCPLWCTQTTHQDGARRDEISHTGPSIPVTIGGVPGPGPRQILELRFWQDPHPEAGSRHGTAMYVLAHLDGQPHEYDAAGLDELVTDLLEAAGKVRYMARRLGVENRSGS
jgi:hypothetical protein